MNIKELKGIGEKTAGLLNRLSVYTVEDLVKLYPRDYDVYEKPVFIGGLTEENENTMIAVEAVVAKKTELYRAGKRSIVTTEIRDLHGAGLKCTWFNMPFLRSALRLGTHYVFRGRLALKQGVSVLEQPQMYTMEAYTQLMGSMQPVYPLTQGLSNKTVVKAVRQALDRYGGPAPEFIPKEIRARYELAEHSYAVFNIHFPKSGEEYAQARKRLAFEEFFLFVLAVRALKTGNERRPNGYVIPNDPRTEAFMAGLDFALTDAQQRTWVEVRENMAGSRLMSRLIQGDVGCGKTIIAVLALMNTVFAGYQAAMMVPTEVLAKQQYESICALFAKAGLQIRVSLLVGSMSAAAKQKEYGKIQTGESGIIIGTHALIQEKVLYRNLALVITDEQHRFGVQQRRSLSEKGKEPHILVMSATPIPRTLAIIVYGDLDISVIDALPANRLPIRNCVVDVSYRPRAYRFILEQVLAGRQAYVICPMVEESAHVEAENVADYAARLQAALPPQVRIAVLHGRMKGAQKNEIMSRFAAGETDVLVSTTVIEVGVNVPNATVMMVENADRFGLAQLHQLRGRVGRGHHQSYCIFVSDSKNKKTRERLEILNRSNDGFEIAEADLKLRGPGDFFGVRQSGELDFGIGDIYTDAAVLKAAADAAGLVLQEDPKLSAKENRYLAQKVSDYTLKCLEKLNL